MTQTPTVSIETITPAVASKMLLQNTHNRPLSRATVRLYSEAMQRGEWDGHSQIVFSENGELLDGQHRLAAVVDSGVTITAVVLRGAPTGAQETIDTGKKRSFANVLTLRGEQNATSVAASTRFVQRAMQGDLRNNKPATNKQLLAVLDEHPGIRDFATFPGLKQLPKIGIGIPMSVACGSRYLFSLVDGEDAEAFFAALASGADLQPGSPILALRQKLEQTRIASGTVTSPATVAAWVIKAWNAWRRGDQMFKLQWRVGGANPEPFPAIDGLTEALSEKRVSA